MHGIILECLPQCHSHNYLQQCAEQYPSNVGHPHISIATCKRRRDESSFCTSGIFNEISVHSIIIDRRDDKGTKRIWEEKFYELQQHSLTGATRNEADAIS